MAPDRMILLLAAMMGLSGLVMAAAGSHAVPGLDDFSNYRSWQAASSVHLIHAVVLLSLSLVCRRGTENLIVIAAVCMGFGVVLFSGSIYLSLTGVLPAVSRVAPAGGMLLMLGWALIGVHALRRPQR
jgi:uncharacterized membrane protein YgdD (TMEM256/DUF423 family)